MWTVLTKSVTKYFLSNKIVVSVVWTYADTNTHTNRYIFTDRRRKYLLLINPTASEHHQDGGELW